ncbi:YSIRK-type signal peptide-containing protein, partial [Lactobacillus delbrueckii]
MNSGKKMMNEPSSEKQRWSLRKLSVGMTSVLLGATMFWASGAGSQVKADTTTASEQAAQTQTNTARKAGTESTKQTEDNNANAD